MIAIVDYGAGNIRNVLRALTHLGYDAKITADHKEIMDAQAVVLPGVGAAGDTVAGLRSRGLDDVVRRIVELDRPFMGVCVGLQVLFDTTEEGGLQPCLGIIPGEVRRLPAGLKVPHMGWNQLRQRKGTAAFEGVPDEANFYFVHSYYVEPLEPQIVVGTTIYGVEFCCAVSRGNLFATQFHPEKSGPNGLRVYDNFLKSTLRLKVPVLGSHSGH